MQDVKCHELVIVGCGASGMTAGCIAGLYCDDVLIIDSNNVPGKKLLATGNGRCNFTNTFMRADRYNTQDSGIMDIIDGFGFDDVMMFFERLGVPVRIRDGYCYPYSLEAVSIRDALAGRLAELGVKIKLNNKICSVEKDNDTDRFRLYTESGYCYEAKKVILACAGKTNSSFGCDGGVYDILKKLGAVNIVKPLPALVGLSSDHPRLKELAGVRTPAKVILRSDTEEIRHESGEIIFSGTGISGIPVMNMSRYASRLLDNGRKCSIVLDFFEEQPANGLTVLLGNMCRGRNVTLRQALTGIINHKLLDVIIEESGNKDRLCEDEALDLSRMTRLLKGFELNITGTAGFDNAQVTTGGLSLDEIDTRTMEAKFCKNLYITGETLDVDGCCGGYNLQWAWSTGAAAGAAATVGKLEAVKLYE